MKKINGKYIRLSESDLKRIVNEEVQKILEYKNPRRDLVDAAKNNIGQLIEHWCILKFYRATQLPTTDLIHWASEVAKFMSNIGKIKLKGGMNDFATRKKAITEGLEKEGVLDDNTYCKRCLIYKLFKERVNRSNYEEVIDGVANDCFNEIPLIIDIIARYDIYEMEEYIEKL